MGSFESGQPRFSKDTTSETRSIDVRRLQRENLLTPCSTFRWTWKRDGAIVASIELHAEPNVLVFSYRRREKGGAWQNWDYPVRLTWSVCHFGGWRRWFLCPAAGCGRRVAKLYLGGSGIFACRHCCALGYACQREDQADRKARRANKIRDRLGWQPGIFNGAGAKPKWMHWKTYWRLRARHNELVNLALDGLMCRRGDLGPFAGLVEDLRP